MTARGAAPPSALEQTFLSWARSTTAPVALAALRGARRRHSPAELRWLREQAARFSGQVLAGILRSAPGGRPELSFAGQAVGPAQHALLLRWWELQKVTARELNTPLETWTDQLLGRR